MSRDLRSPLLTKHVKHILFPPDTDTFHRHIHLPTTCMDVSSGTLKMREKEKYGTPQVSHVYTHLQYSKAENNIL